jgi:tRNA1(Val) A37 N6-methylase TrmN6
MKYFANVKDEGILVKLFLIYRSVYIAQHAGGFAIGYDTVLFYKQFLLSTKQLYI